MRPIFALNYSSKKPQQLKKAKIYSRFIVNLLLLLQSKASSCEIESNHYYLMQDKSNKNNHISNSGETEVKSHLCLNLGIFLVTHVFSLLKQYAFQCFSETTMQHMISISMSSFSVVKQKLFCKWGLYCQLYKAAFVCYSGSGDQWKAAFYS